MNVELRQADHSDTATVFQFYADGIRAHIEKIWGWDEPWQRNDFKESLQFCDTQIVEVDSHMAGYVQTESRQGNLFVRMMILGQDYRSRGVGRIVINLLAHKAVDSGGVLQLKVFRVNDRAFKFYLANGFCIKSEDSVWYTMERVIAATHASSYPVVKTPAKTEAIGDAIVADPPSHVLQPR